MTGVKIKPVSTMCPVLQTSLELMSGECQLCESLSLAVSKPESSSSLLETCSLKIGFTHGERVCYEIWQSLPHAQPEKMHASISTDRLVRRKTVMLSSSMIMSHPQEDRTQTHTGQPVLWFSYYPARFYAKVALMLGSHSLSCSSHT